MKLYEVPRETYITLGDGSILLFHSIDGMYSCCTDSEGNIVHIVAWAEVEIYEGVLNDKE